MVDARNSRTDKWKDEGVSSRTSTVTGRYVHTGVKAESRPFAGVVPAISYEALENRVVARFAAFGGWC